VSVASRRAVSAVAHRPTVTVGVALPFFDHQMDYEDIVRFATTAESSGFDGIWLVDHLVAGPTQQFGQIWYDGPTLLAGLAQLVPRVTLGTDVLIVPYRHPVVAAKVLATLDVVSGGRLVVGVGCGYLESEFETLGANYRDRGAVTDEYLQVWRSVWTEGPAEFAGDYVSLAEAEMGPRPVQHPHPPILVGGNSAPALRRAARYGDGWHPLGLSPYDYGRAAARLQTLTDQMGRPQPTLSYSGNMGAISAKPVESPDRPRLSGSVDQILDDVGQLRDQGVVNFVFRPGGADFTVDEVLDQVRTIGAEVVPRVAQR